MIERNYNTAEEREVIFSDLSLDGLVLVAEKNISEGNFLYFATEQEIKPVPVYEDYLIDLDFRLSIIELGL